MNGSYRVHVDLPAGYHVAENDFLYEVSNRINYHLLSLVKDVIKPNPEVHSGAIVEPWIQPENPTLVIDEVPSRQSVTPATPTPQPETPAQPAASETKRSGNKQTSRCHLSYGWSIRSSYYTSNRSSKNRTRSLGFNRP